MPFDLSGKHVVLSGGNDGIGLATCRRLGSAGATIVIWARSKERNERAKSTLAADGIAAHVIECDVSLEADIDQAMAQTLHLVGSIDAGVVNAGVAQTFSRFTDLTYEEWRRVHGVNLDGGFLMSRALARHMVERAEGGSIVFVSSLGAVYGQAYGEAYSSSKTGLLGLSRAMAAELGQFSIRVNAVLPGWTRTKLTEELLEWDRFSEQVFPRIPMQRWGEPRDIAGIVAYLVSDDSSWHTGSAITVDGGYSVF